MTTHSNLSPSKRDRWSACPGSVREEAKYPDPPSGAAAIDGTHTHSLLAKCIDDGLPAQNYIGLTLTDHEGSFVVDAERAVRVQVALDYIAKRKEELTNCVVKSESKVSPEGVLGRSDLAGTADIQIGSLTDGIFEIADYKDGMALVEPDAKQMRQYAVSALSMLHEDNRARINTVRLTVIQPKLAAKGIEPVRWKEFPAIEFYFGELNKLQKEAEATDDPNAPLIPGDHCKYCKHGGACSARANTALTASGINFANLDVAKDAAAKEPTELSDEQIKELVEAAPLLRQLLESVEAEALRRMEAGKVIAGLKIVRGRGSRAWAYDEEDMVEKLKKFGLTKGEIYKATLVTPAAAEKLIESKATLSGKDPSRKLKTLSDEYVKKTDGRLTVALESDARPAVMMSVAPMFGAIDEIPEWLR